MTSDPPIAIVLDTNIADDMQGSLLSNFVLPAYENACDFIEKNELSDQVEIYLPELVLLEICEHRVRDLNSEIDLLKKSAGRLHDIPGIEIQHVFNPSFNAEQHIAELSKLKLKGYKIIPIPQNHEELFDTTLQMAIKKRPPFQEKKSDKGFKDAIILLSIIEFFKGKNYKEIVFFSKDNGFNTDCINKVRETTGLIFNIEKIKDVQGYLTNSFSVPQITSFKQYLDETNFFEKLGNRITDFQSILREKLYGITTINAGDITINEVSDTICEVTVGFAISGEDLQTGNIANFDDVQGVFTFEQQSDHKWTQTNETFNYQLS